MTIRFVAILALLVGIFAGSAPAFAEDENATCETPAQCELIKEGGNIGTGDRGEVDLNGLKKTHCLAACNITQGVCMSVCVGDSACLAGCRADGKKCSRRCN